MKRGFIAAIGVAMVLTSAAQAGIIAEETWETGDASGWTETPIVPSAAAAPASTSAGNGTFGLSVGTPATFFPAADSVQTDSGASTAFLGNWAADSTDFVSFDFYLDPNADAGGFNTLNFYFVGTGSTWYYDVNVGGQTAGTWATYSVPISDGSQAGWHTPVPNSFSTAIGSVTEMGFEVGYISDGTVQTFGFDNVRRGYTVPEPETYAAIGFALVALAMAFRKQLSDMLAVVRVPSVL